MSDLKDLRAAGEGIQAELRDAILAEDRRTEASRARIAAFAFAGYQVERTTGAPYENPLVAGEKLVSTRTAAFGIYLKDRRLKAGLSQRRLADLTGLDHTYISKLEHGVLPSTPRRTTLEDLALVLGCDVEEMHWQAGRLTKTVERILLEAGPQEWRALRSRYGTEMP